MNSGHLFTHILMDILKDSDNIPKDLHWLK